MKYFDNNLGPEGVVKSPTLLPNVSYFYEIFIFIDGWKFISGMYVLFFRRKMFVIQILA